MGYVRIYLYTEERTIVTVILPQPYVDLAEFTALGPNILAAVRSDKQLFD